MCVLVGRGRGKGIICVNVNMNKGGKCCQVGKDNVFGRHVERDIRAFVVGNDGNTKWHGREHRYQIHLYFAHFSVAMPTTP